jgi:hypothetical protein
MSEWSEIEQITTAIAALIAICPVHVNEHGQAYTDADCGDCGSRQDAVRIYLLSLLTEAEEALLV